jgi:L-ascorbate metabolism protein UlaG (beta-lactamase superfamily)
MRQTAILLVFLSFAAIGLSGCAAPATATPSPVPDTAVPAAAAPTDDLPPIAAKLHWFGTSAILYHGSKNVYFDPVLLQGNVPAADVVLISHAHSDHADIESLRRIVTPRTVLIISPDVTSFYESHKAELGVEAIVLDEGETAEAGGIKVRAVPAFDTAGHPRSAKGMGYVVEVDGTTIYFAGGTRMYPEMADIRSDVTIYPWYQNADILAAAEIMQTKTFIPVHAGYTGVKSFVEVYQKDFPKLTFVALEPGPYPPL